MTRTRHKKENYWISLSDIMTGLMVIFMFIAISYVSQIKKQQRQRDQIVEEYNQIMVSLYNDLQNEFKEDFKRENWNAQLGEDLSIRFVNPDVLFNYNSSRIRSQFKEILDDFYPRYMGILLSDKYRKSISEVRIEGHTDSDGSYKSNLLLSQERTTSVLNYLFYDGIQPLDNFSLDDRYYILFWFTANGFSEGRTVDSDGRYTMLSGNSEDPERSRRVEFRIVTKTEELFKDLVEQINDGSI